MPINADHSSESQETYINNYPFLPSFAELFTRKEEDADLLIGTCAYLIASDVDDMQMQDLLLPLLKSRFVRCLVRSPRTTLEIAALLLMSVFRPMLLGSSSEGVSCDGRGLLVSAITAARSIGLDSTLHHLSPTASQQEMRDGMLWALLSLQGTMLAFCGDTKLHQFARCRTEDFRRMQSYLEHLAEQHQTGSEETLLWTAMLVHRIRSANSALAICQEYCALVEGTFPDKASVISTLATVFHAGSKALESLTINFQKTTVSIWNTFGASSSAYPCLP